MRGKLSLNIYGTRDGASNWQEHLAAHMIKSGFRRGVGHPSIFWHDTRKIMCLVHGDDYFSAGDASELAWFEGELAKEYEIKVQKLGPAASPEGKVLNRIVRWKEDRWEVEADPRHAELIMEQLNVTGGGGITTAGPPQEEGASEEGS